MTHSNPTIAIDCMGGDHGLPVTVPAAMAFAQAHPDTRCLLVGDEALIRQTLHQNAAAAGQFEILHASEVVTMHDSVEIALRRKKDSSMRVAAQAVKDGRADAAVSAGNTGAWMAISRYVLKTLDGIDRPAIATALPNQKGGATTAWTWAPTWTARPSTCCSSASWGLRWCPPWTIALSPPSAC